jgi:hypothetical protein
LRRMGAAKGHDGLGDLYRGLEMLRNLHAQGRAVERSLRLQCDLEEALAAVSDDSLPAAP